VSLQLLQQVKLIQDQVAVVVDIMVQHKTVALAVQA
jgi:hypothetical protein